MTTMNISLPDTMKSFVDEQVRSGSYASSSEYLRDLIRREQDRVSLKNLLLAGAGSPLLPPIQPSDLESLRQLARADSLSEQA